MIPFKNRFHGHNSLTYVYKNGQAVRSHLIILKFVANKHRKDSRIAVVISKKTLKSAVRRNRIRRRVYEYIRSKLPDFNGVYDVVALVSSAELLNVSNDDMTMQIDQLFDQAGILKSQRTVQKTE